MPYRLLGRVEVIADDGRPVSLTGEKERALLAALLLGANRVVSSTRLIDVLWGEEPPRAAGNALQVQVSRLRRKLSTGVLHGEPLGYRLEVGPGDLDSQCFEELVHVDGGSPAEVAARLGDALGLWRGPALADVRSEALGGEAARLEELRLLALERRIDAGLALGRHPELVGELEALVHEYPLREKFRGQLMVALYRSGRQADALAEYRRGRAVLEEELGIDPGPALQELELGILNQAAELAAPPRRRDPPSGDATFLFTDIEGSTWLVQKLGPEWDVVLEEHYRVLRGVWAAHDGYEVSTEGDAFFVVFEQPADAVAAAVEAQRALRDHTWPGGVTVRVRMGLHTGQARRRGDNYMGLDVHVAARVESAAHGGQVLVSEATHQAVAGAVEGIGFVDLGRHRLKDIIMPVGVYQLTAEGLESRFPAPRTLSALPHNLGVALTSFVGRLDDQTALRRILEESRLVSLVGPGGVGKTRFALQVAAEALDGFSGGVWLVNLAALSDPSLVASAAASAVGVAEQPGRAALDTLADYLTPRSTLLVLDNCEHLLDGCAEVASRLLSACPDVKILATTREALNITGEVLWPLRSLTVPGQPCEMEELLTSEAVVLFAERCRAVEPVFEVTAGNADAVAQICRRLDGMPLAIELAASRVRSLGVHEIAGRLDDRFRLLTGGPRSALPRHRTLEAAVAWSYDLLCEEERVLFDRLSVFSGGCTIDAAEQTCSGGPVAEERVAELLAVLADRSMLLADQTAGARTRYRTLETLRQFGQHRLLARAETEATRDRHLDWAVDFAENALPPTGPSKEEPEVAAEEHNLRAALDWALERGHEEAALRIISAVWFGHFNQRAELLGRLLPPSADVPPPLAAKALWSGLGLAFMMGDWELGRQRGELGAAAARAAGNDLLLSLCLSYHGMCAWALGAEDEARRLAEESVAVARAANVPEAESRGQLSLVFLAVDRNDLAQAEQAASRAKEISSDPFTLGHVDEALGVIYFARGELARSAAQLADTVEQFRAIQVNCGAHLLETCAAWAAATNQFALGAELEAAAGRIRDETADKPWPSERTIQRDWLPLIPAHLDSEAYLAAQKRGRMLSFEEALDLAQKHLGSYRS